MLNTLKAVQRQLFSFIPKFVRACNKSTVRRAATTPAARTETVQKLATNKVMPTKPSHKTADGNVEDEKHGEVFFAFSKKKALIFATKLDDFFRFNKNRPLYFTSIIQALLIGYITNLITNSRLQKELDTSRNKIGTLNTEKQELTQTHQKEIMGIKSEHKDEITTIKHEHKGEITTIKHEHKDNLLNQSDAAKAIINELQDEIKYQKGKKNTYKNAYNRSWCFFQAAPNFVIEDDIITGKEESTATNTIG